MFELKQNLTLGIDLGTNSIGWGILESDNGKYKRIIDGGSRIFEAGMEGDIASGNADSRCAKRREKRGIRRSLLRNKRRKLKVWTILKDSGLLPVDEDVEEVIKNLDQVFYRKYNVAQFSNESTKNNLAHILPYFLRGRALDHDLEKYELGRALYHLAQRRGFLSNRKNELGKDEDIGQVKQGISELSEKMKNTGARTLGEYFAQVDPKENKIRGLWTSRQMYVDEFRLICDRQKTIIDSELKQKLYHAIFYQRPLKNAKHLIGTCQFEYEEKKAPWYRYEAQEYRYLQSLNNLIISTPGKVDRDLTTEEWNSLREVLSGKTGDLDRNGNFKLTKARKLLKLPKDSTFTIEAGGESMIKGDRTTVAMKKIFGERWDNFDDFDKMDIIQDIRSYRNSEALAKRGRNHWELDHEASEEFAKTALEEGYCNLSIKAINKLLPALREGKRLMESVKEVYPDYFKSKSEIFDLLPRLEETELDIRNPVVARCLTELRKVINSIIRKYGKPGKIKIELARDVKNSKKVKKAIIDRNRNNENERQRAQKLIFEELGIENPSRSDVTKVLLWEECNRECPYTQKTISISALLADSQYDIEHIIPFSRSLDDSFANKTLCFHHENRNIKKNQTPFEAYHGTEKYEKIRKAVSKFKGQYAAKKLARFQMTPKDVDELFSDFSSRQLNDTRYASKLACDYLSLLYGGLSDSNGKKRIFAVAGGITYIVRAFHGMNNILGDGVKNRDDHRHHAIDAVAVALVGDGTIRHLTDIIKNNDKIRIFDKLKTKRDFVSPPGWNSFWNDFKSLINEMITSHHVSKKIKGALHEETFYSKTYKWKNEKHKETDYRHFRIPLTDLDAKKINAIVDPVAKETIISKLKELDEKNPSKAFKNEENLPVLTTRDGKAHSIMRKVRIRRKQDTVAIGEGKRSRNVVGGSNHHMEIVALLDEKGEEVKWEGHVVSMLEARERIRQGIPLIKTEFDEGKLFKFSLFCGDIIEMETQNGRELFVIRSIPESKQIMYVSVNDARKKNDIKNTKEWFSSMPGSLKGKNPIKYSINPLGELRRAND